jgi:hypothetical protein
MTSVFEVLSNKEIWPSEAQAKATIQNMHQEVLDYTKHEEKLTTVRPITQRYFMICQTCFWCASYIGTMDISNELPFEICPTCNDNKFESLPILYDEFHWLTSSKTCIIFPVTTII